MQLKRTLFSTGSRMRRRSFIFAAFLTACGVLTITRSLINIHTTDNNLICENAAGNSIKNTCLYHLTGFRQSFK
jgi:hypothetical protein